MFRRLLSIALLTVAVLALPAAALAQEYSFSVPAETIDVWWDADGTAALKYTFVFTNNAGAHAIDFVDVGMPNSNWDIANAGASVDAKAVQVSTSDYQGSGSGFAVVLGNRAIPAGASGKVQVTINQIGGLLKPDSFDSKYASAVFGNTYFASGFLSGTTNLRVTFHLPPGVAESEPRFHEVSGWPGASAPATGFDSDNRIIYTWESTQASVSTQYIFGASFPQSYVPADAITTAPSFNIGAIFDWLWTFGCCGAFGLLFVGMPILGVVRNRKRKMEYLPPKISVEGHGIKRGLTAVEAAILLQEPLDKVMTMILFGAIKKGAGKVIAREPLQVEAVAPAPEGLRDYESSLLAALTQKDTAESQKLMQAVMVNLVQSVTEKMKGFSRDETKAYYRNIMEQAWGQVQAAQTPEVKGQAIDQNLEWTMLDRDFEDRSRRVFAGPIYMPMWWGSYDPRWRTAPAPAPVGTSAGIPAGGSSALPGADLAASVVGGVQSFASNVVGGIGAFTNRVTQTTNPVPIAATRGGGGHSCACACACAGCACACAGGGR